MARPAKATKLLSGHATKDEIAAREAAESKLRGPCGKIVAPGWLSREQKKIFNFVVRELSASEILGSLDVYVLTQFAVATERMFDLERMINEEGCGTALGKDLIFARNSYVKDFWRGANELSLSPQARAKIGTLSLARMDEESDPLKKLLAGKG